MGDPCPLRSYPQLTSDPRQEQRAGRHMEAAARYECFLLLNYGAQTQSWCSYKGEATLDESGRRKMFLKSLHSCLCLASHL